MEGGINSSLSLVVGCKPENQIEKNAVEHRPAQQIEHHLPLVRLVEADRHLA